MELVPKTRFSYYFLLYPPGLYPIVLNPAQVCTQDLNIFESHASYCLYVCSRYKSISKISLKKTSEAKNVFVEVRISVDNSLRG